MGQALRVAPTSNRIGLFGSLTLPFFVLFTLMAAHFTFAASVTADPAERLLPFEYFARAMIAGIWPILAFVLWVGILLPVRRVENPTRAMLAVLQRNRFWAIRSLILFAAMMPTALSFVAIKNAIPALVPFYLDPPLVQLDRILFLGFDPWQITHAVIGEQGTRFLDWAYVAWSVPATLLVLWACFDRNPRFQFASVFTLFCCWVGLGNVLAILLSSVGPIFYEQFYGASDFVPLMANLPADLNLHTSKAFLLDAYGRGDFGSGISAAPSLHVAITMLIFIMLRDKFRNRAITLLASAYVALIFVGSIHLAWHYAIDGIISLIAVPLFWKLAHWLMSSGYLRSSPGDAHEGAGSSSLPM